MEGSEPVPPSGGQPGPAGEKTAGPEVAGPGTPGAPPPAAGGPIGPAPEPGASGLAIASMVLSLLGVFCILPAIAGLIMGIIELNRIKSGQSPAAGKTLAVVGVIVGALVMAVAIVVIIIAAATGGLSFEFNTSTT